MTKNAPLFVLLLSLSLFYGCMNSHEEDREVELSTSEVSEKVMDMIIEEQAKEKILVRQHYNQLSSAERAQITFNQYYADLAQRYQKVTEQALKDVELVSSDEEDATLQAEQIQSEHVDKQEIPDWYWQMKQSTKDKIVKMTLGSHR